jgi:hypothetical protein
MSKHSTIYVGRNSANLVMDGLKDPDSGEYQNDATVVVDSVTSGGSEVDGLSLPITLAYVSGSNGRYEGSIEGDQFSAGRQYVMTFFAIASNGKRFEAEELVFGRQRRA